MAGDLSQELCRSIVENTNLLYPHMSIRPPPAIALFVSDGAAVTFTWLSCSKSCTLHEQDISLQERHGEAPRAR